MSLKAILRGSEGTFPTLIASNEDPRENIFPGGDTNCDWNQEGVSTNAPDYGNRYTHTHTTSNFLVPSTLQSISRAPIIVPYQEQRASQGQLEQFYKTGKGTAAVPSRSSCRPGGNRGSPQDRYVCSTCGRTYAQQRGVTRHHRDVHEVSFCMHCRNFKWHRHHQLKEHLEEQHPDVNLFVALSEATRSRRKATITSNRLRRQRAPLHAIEYARWGFVESPPRRSMPPPPARAKITPVSTRDNACKLELPDAVYAYTAFQSTKEHAPLATDLSTSSRSMEVGLVHAFVCVVRIFSDPRTVFSGLRIKGSQLAQKNALLPPVHPTKNMHFTLHQHLWISGWPGLCGSNHFPPGADHVLTVAGTWISPSWGS